MRGLRLGAKDKGSSDTPVVQTLLSTTAEVPAVNEDALYDYNVLSAQPQTYRMQFRWCLQAKLKKGCAAMKDTQPRRRLLTLFGLVSSA